MIALATKAMPYLTFRKLQTLRRTDVESELSFLGFLILENKLKPSTTEVIQKLTACEIRSVMATGDNVLTAISVARQCEMISPTKEVILGDLIARPDGSGHDLKWSS